MNNKIPFNKPFLTGQELPYIEEAHALGHLSGDGSFTKRCHQWLEARYEGSRALLTHSCTGALEMAAILSNIGPGDEVIMPSYTFVSTANAFVLRGATPVFIDIRPDTLNLDETLLARAITPRTRAIVPVHYAGVGCEMDTIVQMADAHDLTVIEDAAQAIGSNYRGRSLGTFGDFATLSFHETKNVISGEGGALLVNGAPERFEKAEIIREKGTNRQQFFRGHVDKYTWVDIGSSYLPSEIVAAFLLAQLEQEPVILERRLAMWEAYHAAFEPLEQAGILRRPVIPEHCVHNAHMYYLLLPDLETRSRFIRRMKESGIVCVFHYVPLHSSPYGRNQGRVDGELPVTDDLSDRLVRMPLWIGMESVQPRIVETALSVLRSVA